MMPLRDAAKILMAAMLCLAGPLVLGLSAQDYTITRTVCIPAIYHVGDEVELRLGIRSDFAAKMVVPQNVTQPAWGAMRNIQILNREDEVELRLRFTCFIAGTHSLPAINVGPVVLEGINIFVTPLAGDATVALQNLREQANVPGTWQRLILQSAILVLVPLGIILALWWGIPRFRHYRALRQEQKPYRRLIRSLAAGRENLADKDELQFYTWLLGEARQYLTERWHAPVQAATSTELATLVHQRIHHQETADSLVAVFVRADRVRFAGEVASPRSCLDDLGIIEAAIGHIEQEERLRRRANPRPVPGPAVRLHVRRREGQNAGL